MIVLKTIDDEIIVKAAKFRQSGRFPVLSYYHKENGVSHLSSVIHIKNSLYFRSKNWFFNLLSVSVK